MGDQATDDLDAMSEEDLRAEVERLRQEAPQRAYGKSGGGPGGGPGGGILRGPNAVTGAEDFGAFQQDVAQRFNRTQTGPMSHRGGPDSPSFNELSQYVQGSLGRHITRRLLGYNSRLRDGLERSGVDVEALRQELGG